MELVNTAGVAGTGAGSGAVGEQNNTEEEAVAAEKKQKSVRMHVEGRTQCIH